MKRNILLYGTAREGSTRVKNKMTRPFGNTTLFDLYMKLFEEVQKSNHLFSNIFMALNKNDKILWDKAQSYNVKIQERSDFSAHGAESMIDLYHFLAEYNESHVMWVNGCFPFLTPKTILNACELFMNNNVIKSMHCVKERQNWFWLPDSCKCLNVSSTDIATQDSKPIYESVHCLHIHNRKYILETNALWSFSHNDPYLYVLPDSIGFLDIDTETDFEICEAVWNQRRR